MRICIIVAMAENRTIGRAGDLPWRISADLKQFKELTVGHPVIMGRNTFQSIGRPLADRTNIIITRNREFETDGVEITHSLDSALDLGRDIAIHNGVDDVMVAGGGAIYAIALAEANRVYMTEVHRAYDGDTVFPELDEDIWHVVARERHGPETPDGPAFSFVVIDKFD